MSLILHMKIPGAIVAASDCRITGTEAFYVSVQGQMQDEDVNLVIDSDKHEMQKKADTKTDSTRLGRYEYIKTDNEQKTFLLKNNENRPFAISYCGNASLNGYPASYQIQRALKNMTDSMDTGDIAKRFKIFWGKEKITSTPNFLISGYNAGKASVLELKQDGNTLEHYNNAADFGITYHGETSVAKAIINLGGYNFSLFRVQDAVNFCATMIATTAKIQAFQNKQQTVSKAYDLLVITEQKANWIKRSTYELV